MISIHNDALPDIKIPSDSDILRQILSEPGRLRSFTWPQIFAAFPPARLSRISHWLRCYFDRNHHERVRSDIFRAMTGRVARTAVTARPDITLAKGYGPTTVKFGVFEKAVSRFAIDLYKADGFAHEPYVVRYLHEAIDDRTLFVDIGAHFGYFTCLAAARGGTVLAVELQRTLCQNIEANAVVNDFWRIHTICAAIGPAPGVTQVERMDPTPGKQVSNHQFASSPVPMHSQNHEIVPVVTVDSLVGTRMAGAFERTIVKLDIEGAEVLALRGAAETIAAGAAIFVIEIHLTEIGKFNGSLEEVLDSFPGAHWRMILMEDGSETELDRDALIAASVRWLNGDGNLCVRFEPR
ncbi:MAG: FkbM family methyltransferase [Thalassobaculaceae bacterium]|nr:FkbM family methyltransferase [Thalassobaculaceae bacterium]